MTKSADNDNSSNLDLYHKFEYIWNQRIHFFNYK